MKQKLSTKSYGSLPEPPRWESLLLICKDCRRRKNGPRHLKAKTLASDVKPLLKTSMPGGRAVLTSCLRLRPKNATAVAVVGAVSTPRIVAIDSSDHLQELFSRLMGES